MAMEKARIEHCCQEVEMHLLEVGAQKCGSLADNSQLAAVLFLLLRSLSLFRSMIELIDEEQLDAFDCVRRSFLESWLLAFELRMKDSSPKAAKWNCRLSDAWKLDIAKLQNYSSARDKRVPKLGKYYGELTELAHPTRSAAENSVSLTSRRFGVNTQASAIEQAKASFHEEIPELLYELLSLVFDKDGDLIPLHIDETRMPEALEFLKAHPHL